MKKLVTILAITIATAGGAFARIGETLNQAVQRYGQFVDTVQMPWTLILGVTQICMRPIT
jgi:hypothetical protein